MFVPDKCNTKYKGLEERMCLVCSPNSEVASVEEMHKAEGRKQVRAVMGAN